MKTSEVRKKFIEFFKNREHAILASVSLVTPDEKGVTNATLFNTAGVQPLIPYLLGKDHPEGKRLASTQKCVRTIDIDEVGDKTHLTFFEMLGNWSLGDYFKEEAIKWSYEFLTSKEDGLGLDPERIYITVFGGNRDAPKDDEAIEIWKKYVPENRIYVLESNWWEAGENGPCGPDTEMFYDTTEEGLGDIDGEDAFTKADDAQDIVEVWNNVFMQYEKKDGKIVGNLPRHGVDTGAGLERLTYVINGKDNVYEIDTLSGILKLIEENSSEYNSESARIVTDHILASTFLISDGVTPSNTDRGYILRRLIRRAIRHADKLGLPQNFIQMISKKVVDEYKEVYGNLNTETVQSELGKEEEQFRKTLNKGLKELEKLSGNISGEEAFKLFSTYGFPIELTKEIAEERGIKIDTKQFDEEMKKHQELSRTSSGGKFKGGLEGHGEQETKYHTATHLLHKALREVLGSHVEQKGSNINADRLRFDFSHTEKMTDEEEKAVEDKVNGWIKDALPVQQVTLPKEEAEKTGALHLFSDKYEDDVSIYFVGDSVDTAISKEFCGGPHVSNTSELGSFRIKKEEASSAGVRRIKAVLE